MVSGMVGGVASFGWAKMSRWWEVKRGRAMMCALTRLIRVRSTKSCIPLKLNVNGQITGIADESACIERNMRAGCWEEASERDG